MSFAVVQRLAFIGSRGHYSTVLRELPEHPGQRIVAVADGGEGDSSTPIVNWTRTQACTETPTNYGSDWIRLLDEAAVDAVVLCGPFELQATMASAAIERGVHVMVEKPGALHMEDLAMLRTACERRPDVHLASMLFSRYAAGFYTAAQIVRAGAIGDIRLIEARKSYKLGARGGHFKQRRTYGGTILWVGSHAIDWVAWMAGQAFRSVYATHSSAGNDAQLGSMERSALCHFKLTNGCAASVAIDVFRPDRAPTHGDDWIRLVGTKGVIEARPGKLVLIDAHQDGIEPLPLTCERKPWRDFVDHVERRASAIVDANDTLRLADACLRARQSADENRVVEFDLDDAAPRRRPVVHATVVREPAPVSMSVAQLANP
jgi:predicted dehydrogenase